MTVRLGARGSLLARTQASTVAAALEAATGEACELVVLRSDGDDHRVPLDAPSRPGAFVAALVVWSLLARLIRMLIHATPLSLPDRLLGAGFGLLRGGVLLLAVASAVLLTPASQSQGWRVSHGARWLGLTLQLLKPLLPEPAARLLPA